MHTISRPARYYLNKRKPAFCTQNNMCQSKPEADDVMSVPAISSIEYCSLSLLILVSTCKDKKDQNYAPMTLSCTACVLYVFYEKLLTVSFGPTKN